MVTIEKKEPDNISRPENPIGRFMVAVGAIIRLKGSNKILLVKRSEKLDWMPGEWEIIYGRLDQHETLELGLVREVKEESGLENLIIGSISRRWHIYRGEKCAHNELIGLTFICETNQQGIRLSSEHTEYQWIEPGKALDIIGPKSLRQDIEEYLKLFEN